MTISTTYTPTQYTGNGVTTVFPTVFVFLDTTDIVVTQTVISTGVETDVTGSVTVTGGNGSNGNVTFSVAPTSDHRITISLNIPYTQLQDYVENTAFLAENLERALDRLTLLAQQNSSNASRVVKLKTSDTSSELELPVASARANKFLGFDASGNAIAAEGSADGVTVSTFMATVLDDTDAATARATLGVSDSVADGDYGDITVSSSGTVFTIDNDVVTLAKMAGGTAGNLITYDASGDPMAVATGTSGQVLTSNGTGAAPTFQDIAAGGPTLGTAVATTSGTSIDYTSIPSGTKRITISLNNVSLSGTDNILVQIGDSGGLETTGYNSVSTSQTTAFPKVTSTSGFIVRFTLASVTCDGQITLTLLDPSTNTWACSHIVQVISGGNFTVSGAGAKSLSSELDRLSIITTGTDTFDAGQLNILYE